MLVHVLRADNWYDVYKCVELAKLIAGGGAALKATLGTDWKKWRDTRQTANHFRHAPATGHPLPPQPPTLSEARQFVFRTIARLM